MPKKQTLKLLPHQLKFLRLDAPFKALVAGYGAGKSRTMTAAILRDAAQNPNGRIGAYAPTYDLLKLICITNLTETLDSLGIKYSYNKSDFLIKPQGMGEIIFRSLSNPERIVGYETVAAHIDELDTLPKKKAKEGWQKVIARNRAPCAAGKNIAAVYTTPEGKNFVYERWGKTEQPEYKMMRARSTDNPFLQSDYFDNLRADYPEELLQAYINGEFCNLTSSTVYYNFDPSLNHTDRELQDGDRLVHVGMDFNITNMSAVIAIDNGTTIQIVEEVVGAYDTRDMINLLKQKLGNRQVIVYPDASGDNRSTSSTTTDHQLLKKAFRLKAPNANPAIRDRVNIVLGLLCNGHGDRRLLINTRKAPTLTESLESQVWNPRTGQPDKDGGFDHSNDACGYLCWGLRADKRRSAKPSGIRIY